MAGIYIHIPFCKQACYYCDFHFSTSLKRKDEMLECIKKELLLRKKEVNNEEIKTIYFGGGTPSLLLKEDFNQIFELIYENFKVANNAEITVEANPDDLSHEKIIELSELPVNRLSIGVQSFFEEDLTFMNRAHTAKESKNCIETALKYFKNITIDLIYAVPGMSVEKWKKNLSIAFSLGVPHISSYALTVEEKTALASFVKKGKVKPVDEKKALEHFNILVEEADKNDFVQYEISNFGKEGYFSDHNTSYWLGEKYVGIGPSAHSFNGAERAWNISNNVKYMKSISSGELPLTVEVLSKEDRFNEYIMTGLRTVWGISLHKIEIEFGAEFKKQLLINADKFLSNGHLKLDASKNTIITTKKGKFLADGIASDLFII